MVTCNKGLFSLRENIHAQDPYCVKRNGSIKCAYEVCSNKWQGDDKKMGQKYQNLRLLKTAISQARNKLLTNFQRLESTNLHGLLYFHVILDW